MDDDMPLAGLVKAKAPPKIFDDDTPLALLGGALKKPTPTGASPGEKRGRPSAVAKPGAATPPKGSPPKGSPPKGSPPKRPSSAGKKKGAGSDSSSSDSSDSDSSSSDGKPMLKKARAKGKPGAKRKSVPGKKAAPKEGGEEGGDSDEEEHGPVKKRDRSVKEQAVAELLCRWWYALPDWPPSEESYYQDQLKKRGLRKVTIQEWEWVDDVDKNGLKKVYALSAFKGVVRDGAGELFDLRPQDTCPCYNNMMKKDLPELYALLVTAYEKQLEELKQSRYDETHLRSQLQASLTRVRNKAHQASSLSGSARRTAGT